MGKTNLSYQSLEVQNSLISGCEYFLVRTCRSRVSDLKGDARPEGTTFTFTGLVVPRALTMNFSGINFCTRHKESTKFILPPRGRTPVNYPSSKERIMSKGKSDDFSNSQLSWSRRTHTHTHTRHFPRLPRMSFLHVTRMLQRCTISGVMPRISLLQ